MADIRVVPEEVSPGSEEPREPDGRPPRETTPARRRRTMWIVIGLLVAFVVYAYGFAVTDVNLDKINEETRQESLFRVIRALVQPDLLTYEVAETATDLEYMIPCPSDGFNPGPIDGEASFTVDPPCADPRTEVTISGGGFRPNDDVQIFFIPPNGVELRLDQVRTDPAGELEAIIRLPARPDTAVQTIRVESEQNVGSIFNPEQVTLEDGTTVSSPRWSQNAVETLDKIIETVFLALLATTLGTLIAVPLSFFAARNLMKDIRLPPLQLGLAIAGLPLGVGLGLIASSMTGNVMGRLPDSALLHAGLAVFLGWLCFRLLLVSLPAPGSSRSRPARLAAAAAAVVAALLAAQAVVRFSIFAGAWLVPRLGAFDFLGEFLVTGGEILAALFGLFAAVAGAGLLAFLGSKLGYVVGRRVSTGVRNVLAILAAMVAGALIALAIGQAVAWLYQMTNVRTTVVIPAVVGALIGGLIGWRGLRRDQVPIGMWIYYVARTVFNTLRSIEALILAIVFVIWVGLGAFAGALALALHTIAASAKLYSEQVESIASGPVEAVRATGATRLQTVVYAVVPQIVPPYISFTMYRWDINVRMSTIIGFVGGGGIGLLLQQNIALLDYRAAAAQMLAIAIVVATMDYISSRLRERYV